MKKSYEMLRNYVNAYKNLEYPKDFTDVDVEVIESINKLYEKIKFNIVAWALVYIDEMEGEE